MKKPLVFTSFNSNKSLVIFLICCTFLPSVSNATETNLLYANSPTSITSAALISEQDEFINSFVLEYSSTVNTIFFSADSFTVERTGNEFDPVTSVAWSITPSPTGTALASGNSSSISEFPLGYTSRVFSFDFNSGIILQSGTYFLHLTNAQTSSGWNDVRWLTGPGGTSTAYNENGSASSVSSSFSVWGTATVVPEPSTYGLIGIGALGLAFAARRRKLKSA